MNQNGELPRVPLVKRLRWIGDDDVSVRVSPPMARRISMDVDETALAQFGARVVEEAVRRLGETLPNLYAAEIQRAVDALLFDASWLQPIIEHEVRRACREFVLALWSDDEKKNMRDWFDVFTAKYGTPPVERPRPEPETTP